MPTLVRGSKSFALILNLFSSRVTCYTNTASIHESNHCIDYVTSSEDRPLCTLLVSSGFGARRIHLHILHVSRSYNQSPHPSFLALSTLLHTSIWSEKQMTCFPSESFKQLISVVLFTRNSSNIFATLDSGKVGLPSKPHKKVISSEVRNVDHPAFVARRFGLNNVLDDSKNR